MDLLFENFQFIILIALALGAWVKNRAEAKQDEEAERRAREEMARHLQELDDRPVQKTPPPVPQQWNTDPGQTQSSEPASTDSGPPPLREIFKEVIDSVEPPPFIDPRNRDEDDRAYDDEPAPWEDFRHQDASESEIDDVAHDPLESPMLKRQREMQERLAEIKKEAAQYKGKVAGAKETQRRLARRGQAEEELIPLGSLRSTLKDKRQIKRAIILKEILSKPIALR